ncbi:MULTISPECIES: sigma-54 interaction domain-containing protein [unclassified Clostridioides]|uniref:sigma-54 interaction domain-containing protein n=1 Tax=unclassified Clostridioides TaxID=2635829 RepID=UPI001D0CCAE8|nr:sigma 54-interacting transcriptional regulator [Clostridioides sp. ES-S-0001-02]MCC0641864.1 sigma 54-interacting transcriptional regulator [Clostridioides sp. ES-S-0049-03]MCC0654033.1 sigma 54-interacting transcriptional regulator [Clostridioides sp. ES-S-0001-03]MCC0656348.1 sigma 54-interacting transcriptional regulator [Clostridioides sp. ES-S-0123-01]MCC0674341.1 sigma 54-interacting transcriptional regulator [Clostridioides sp. ES-S-0145-01]MCC0677999.1 sigma 54-interacting transcrip
MDNNLIGLIEHVENPVILCKESGEIIYCNHLIDNIFSFLDIKRPKNINELDSNFDKKDILVNNKKKIAFRELRMTAHIYNMKDNDNENNIVYLFEKSVISDKIVEDIIEHIDEVVVVFNKDGVIEKMNTVSDEILPFKRTEVLGRNITDLVRQGLVEEPIILNMLKVKKKIYRNIVYPDGKLIAYTAVPIWDSKGKLTGGVLTGRDISRVIKLESQIRYSDVSEDTEYISQSKTMDNIKKVVKRAAASDSSIFINGESGVGKEIIARTIYKYSSRREKPFIAINCGAIPNELLESEFFGYEEGSFTGAKKKGKKGLFEEANGGTIFLDEIGELPMQMQKKLLRVIQENTITRIGGSKPIKIDVRYISATNISHEDLRNNLKFRQDLYYRLSVIPVKIPPLRERKEDIVPLVDYFLKLYNDKYNREVEVSPKVIELLEEYSWPGNIRELKNIIERFVVLSAKNVIGEDEFNMLINLDMIDNESNDLSPIVVNGIMNLNDAYKMVDQIMISKAINKYGSITKAAEVIGIYPSTIHRKIKSGYIRV